MFRIFKLIESFYFSVHVYIERIVTKQMIQLPDGLKKPSVALFPLFLILFISGGVLRVLLDWSSIASLSIIAFNEAQISLLFYIVYNIVIQVLRMYILYTLIKNISGVIKQKKTYFVSTLHGIFLFGCMCILSGQTISGVITLFIITPWLYMIKSYYQ